MVKIDNIYSIIRIDFCPDAKKDKNSTASIYVTCLALIKAQSQNKLLKLKTSVTNIRIPNLIHGKF